MKKLNVTGQFLSVGMSSIMVPDNLTIEEAIEYAKEHISDIPVPTQSDCVPDSDQIDEENCDFDETTPSCFTVCKYLCLQTYSANPNEYGADFISGKIYYGNETTTYVNSSENGSRVWLGEDFNKVFKKCEE